MIRNVQEKLKEFTTKAQCQLKSAASSSLRLALRLILANSLLKYSYEDPNCGHDDNATVDAPWRNFLSPTFGTKFQE